MSSKDDAGNYLASTTASCVQRRYILGNVSADADADAGAEAHVLRVKKRWLKK